MFPNAPTFRELGKDYVYYMQRSVVGAPGMSYAAASYYQRLFKKVYNSDEWQKYRKKKKPHGGFYDWGLSYRTTGRKSVKFIKHPQENGSFLRIIWEKTRIKKGSRG
ncbi:MAG: hypothetical protein Ct9H300mP28_00710 [Pseudomonadota bacterium]|nr:MAG: hypothetical protein Ct9H300mP28_00710 [Pseudomonadota bacterium]